jgi:hypothetical protein
MSIQPDEADSLGHKHTATISVDVPGVLRVSHLLGPYVPPKCTADLAVNPASLIVSMSCLVAPADASRFSSSDWTAVVWTVVVCDFITQNECSIVCFETIHVTVHGPSVCLEVC